jgi:hypothetical protein
VGFSLGSSLADLSSYGLGLFSGDFGGASTGHASGSGMITLSNTPITGTVALFTGIEVMVSSGSAMVLNFPLSFGPQDVATTPNRDLYCCSGPG